MIAPIDNSNDVSDENEALAGPHIEPLFWGTSDLLLWDGATLLETLSKRIANTVGAEEGFVTEESVQRVAALLPEGVLLPRALYGYFPVIAEHGTLVVLDPSDFHSEMTILTFDQEQRHLVECCHPDGDIIAFSGVTTGIDLRHVETIAANNTQATDNKVIKLIASLTLSLINEKCTTEIRRGMGISDTAGLLVDANTSVSLQNCIPALFEMLSIEERLGMFRNDDGTIAPQFASLSLFLPRLKGIDTKR